MDFAIAFPRVEVFTSATHYVFLANDWCRFPLAQGRQVAKIFAHGSDLTCAERGVERACEKSTPSSQVLFYVECQECQKCLRQRRYRNLKLCFQKGIPCAMLLNTGGVSHTFASMSAAVAD